MIGRDTSQRVDKESRPLNIGRTHVRCLVTCDAFCWNVSQIPKGRCLATVELTHF